MPVRGTVLVLLIVVLSACSQSHSNSVSTPEVTNTPTVVQFADSDHASTAVCSQFRAIAEQLLTADARSGVDLRNKVWAMADAAVQARVMHDDATTEQRESVAREFRGKVDGGTTPHPDPDLVSAMGQLCR